MRKILLVDFNPLYYRSYHSLKKQGLMNSKGEMTFAIYGFFRSLMSWMKSLKPDTVIVCDDSPSFRRALNADYKSNRNIKRDGEMFDQKQRVLEGLESLSIPVIKLDGMEADDLIATLALTREWMFDMLELEEPFNENSSDIDFHVLTIDYDLLQLVRDNVTVHVFKTLSNTESYTPKYMLQNKGVTPEKWSMYKAIVGDGSDNLKGVNGVGPKKVLEILEKYDSLREGISDNWSKIQSDKIKQYLNDSAEILLMNHQLMDLSFDERKTIIIREVETEKDKFEFFLSEMEFRSMEKDLKKLDLLNIECLIN